MMLAGHHALHPASSGHLAARLPDDVRIFSTFRTKNASPATGVIELTATRVVKLKGRRGGQYSIRINDQWRVCFRWADSGARDVEIVDYH